MCTRFLAIWLGAASLVVAAPRFSISAERVEVFDLVEITIEGAGAGATGNFWLAGATKAATVEGFSDAADGSVQRIRFMPSQPGDYRVEARAGADFWTGSFRAEGGHRRGPVRVDAAHPWHFVWEGTGEHYFWNGLTTYALLGWQDEGEIRAIIDRAARLKVNRLRVTLNGPRVQDASRWYEPVKPSGQFRFLFGPWVGAHPGDVHDPGWDVTRFDPAYWQKVDRTVRYARDLDVAISIIFYLDGAEPGADPFGKARMFSEDEKRYYRYAVNRLAAYSNVMWDVTNEWHLFRDAWWVERMGEYLKSLDPYHHLTSCHGRGDFPWMLSPWADFAMFQLWDEHGGYAEMLKRRRLQEATGRAMPQINEEYGYEDHYPVKWGENRRPPARSADNRRRLQWGIAMAGCYGTTGERANSGSGSDRPTPGGWVNGGFDSSMHMLEGYRHMVDFFASFAWWKMKPAETMVLAEPGQRYVLYLPEGGNGSLDLEAGRYTARWYDPRGGTWMRSEEVRAAGRRTFRAPDGEGDWVLLVERMAE